MSYRVRYKGATRNYLASPWKWGNDELWSWSPRVEQAHVFATRAEAKAMLKELRGGGTAYKLSDFTFEKVDPA